MVLQLAVGMQTRGSAVVSSLSGACRNEESDSHSAQRTVLVARLASQLAHAIQTKETAVALMSIGLYPSMMLGSVWIPAFLCFL